MQKKPKVIAIVGPTASGKTSLSIEIAKMFNGEVISADSRQVYRRLDIGTGKVTTEEMSGVPHHLIDLCEPTDTYTAIDFKRDASVAIDNIVNRNRLPIIAGGTFFYLDQLRGKSHSAPVLPNESLRTELELLSTEELFEKLELVDKERSENIDRHNRRRLIRSLEITDSLGSVPAVPETESTYDWLIIGVDVEKEQLRKNFEKRIRQWLKIGLVEETKKLQAEGITPNRFQEFGFEYKLTLDLIENKITESELIEKFIQKNWQYAKRQKTWLKRDNEVAWFKPEEKSLILKRVKEFLAK